jgi:RNA recognition motif. (a.k.a. RRM, RBD, or RNP domain)
MKDVLFKVRIAWSKHRKRRCRGYGFVRYGTSEQANAAIQDRRRFEFKQDFFLYALPSDENRTLFVGGLTENWDPDISKAVLKYAFPGMRRYASAFEPFTICHLTAIASRALHRIPAVFLPSLHGSYSAFDYGFTPEAA